MSHESFFAMRDCPKAFVSLPPIPVTNMDDQQNVHAPDEDEASSGISCGLALQIIMSNLQRYSEERKILVEGLARINDNLLRIVQDLTAIIISSSDYYIDSVEESTTDGSSGYLDGLFGNEE